mmetsp:Transcript_13599/g.21243  ORF Transcript_13599/g.21243 Transcript_13599/m.21243 type:complete len:83 (-) Transcript_13599:745-993(-)
MFGSDQRKSRASAEAGRAIPKVLTMPKTCEVIALRKTSVPDIVCMQRRREAEARAWIHSCLCLGIKHLSESVVLFCVEYSVE